MNQLQKNEFEILYEFIRVCQKLDLQYYLICGSALGAAKYSGFIPWDDDIDVALPRKDYLTFIEKAQDLLPEYYFVQNYKTERYFHHFCTKIRDSRTTYIEEDQKNLNIHHGVFIDVIPLDLLPEEKSFRYKYRYFRICQLIYLKSKERYKNVIKYFLKKFINIRVVFEQFEKYLNTYDDGHSSAYCNFHNYKNRKLYLDKDIYGKGLQINFEGIDVIVPEKIDEYLTAYYGDWRTDLPKEEQVGHHYYAIMDLNHPYTYYIKKVSKRRKKIVLKNYTNKK